MLHTFKEILPRKAEVSPPSVLQWTGLAQKTQPQNSSHLGGLAPASNN